MLDIKFILENKDLIELGAKKKHIKFDVAELIALDVTRRELTAKTDTKRAEQNAFSQKIVGIADPALKMSMITEMKIVKEDLEKAETELKTVLKKWQALMLQVPNIPDMSVPEGVSDADNKEVKTWGEKPQFTFPAKGHIDLMQTLDMVDFDRGTKVAGFRGYYLKNDAALLSFAIWQYAMDFFLKKDFAPMIVPSLVRRETLFGTGYLPQGEEDLYKTQDDDFLAGTGEVATMAFHSDEILEQKDFSYVTLLSRCSGQVDVYFFET